MEFGRTHNKVKICMRRHTGHEARLQCYVDDPLLATKGTRARRNRLATRFCVALLVLGFDVAFSKAKFNSSVVWIGVSFKITPRTVTVTIPEEKLVDLLTWINKTLKINVVSEKELRSFSGKAMSVASIILTWRPFLAQLWAALSQGAVKAPRNCVWVKQFRNALIWLQEFINGTSGTIIRTFEYDLYYGNPDNVRITTDASPYGIGGFITINGRIAAFFSDEITATDCTILGVTHGSHTGQQAFEALAVLVAVRLWMPEITSRRATLAVRTDNIGALTVVASLKGKGPSMGLVARELALDFGSCSYAPRVVEHLPGVANVLADVLSRRLDPHKQPWRSPAQVAHLSPTQVTARIPTWWRVHTREAAFSTG